MNATHFSIYFLDEGKIIEKYSVIINNTKSIASNSFGTRIAVA
jgi:hypothetical protein